MGTGRDLEEDIKYLLGSPQLLQVLLLPLLNFRISLELVSIMSSPSSNYTRFSRFLWMWNMTLWFPPAK